MGFLKKEFRYWAKLHVYLQFWEKAWKIKKEKLILEFSRSNGLEKTYFAFPSVIKLSDYALFFSSSPALCCTKSEMAWRMNWTVQWRRDCLCSEDVIKGDWDVRAWIQLLDQCRVSTAAAYPVWHCRGKNFVTERRSVWFIFRWLNFSFSLSLSPAVPLHSQWERVTTPRLQPIHFIADFYF